MEAVTQPVRVNHNYVLESSFNLQTWPQVGDQFTADAETVTSEFDVLETGRYFRIREVPSFTGNLPLPGHNFNLLTTQVGSADFRSCA